MMPEKYPTWLEGHVKEWTEKRLPTVTLCSSTGKELLEVWYCGDLLTVKGEPQSYIVDGDEVPGLVAARDPERGEEFVTQLKRDIREYVNRVSDCRIVRDELDSFVELVKLPEKLSPLSKESVLEWFYMHRAYCDDRYDGMGCSGQFFTTRVRLFRRRGCWYAYHFVSVDM